MAGGPQGRRLEQLEAKKSAAQKNLTTAFAAHVPENGSQEAAKKKGKKKRSAEKVDSAAAVYYKDTNTRGFPAIFTVPQSLRSKEPGPREDVPVFLGESVGVPALDADVVAGMVAGKRRKMRALVSSEEEDSEEEGGGGGVELEEAGNAEGELERRDSSRGRKKRGDLGRLPLREAPESYRAPAGTGSRIRSACGSLALAVRNSEENETPDESVGQLVELVEKVDPKLMRARNGEDTSVERAMAVACLQGDCLGAEMYPKKEELMYWRAVGDGMPLEDEDGVKSDAMEWFRPVDYKYLGSEHVKAVSSKRGELSGTKGIRGLFEARTRFNMSRAKTEEDVKEMAALSESLKDGKWHTNEEGAPFSSDHFVSICRGVWKKDECELTSEQLVWTTLVVENFLNNRPFDRNDDVNAAAMDRQCAAVTRALSAAVKAKKRMALKLTPLSKVVNLAMLTKQYVEDGMAALAANGGKKKGKTVASAKERDRVAWNVMEQLAAKSSEEDANKEN